MAIIGYCQINVVGPDGKPAEFYLWSEKATGAKQGGKTRHTGSAYFSVSDLMEAYYIGDYNFSNRQRLGTPRELANKTIDAVKGKPALVPAPPAEVITPVVTPAIPAAPAECTSSTFFDLTKARGAYSYQGTDSAADNYSYALHRINVTTNRVHSLTVRYDQGPTAVKNEGPFQPPERSSDSVIAGWKEGVELQRIRCPSSGNWFWVTFPAELRELVPALTLRQQWDEFFKNPDVIKAIGLLPSSVQESFSLVFSHYSIINGREQDPEPGDYVSVGLILAGVTLAAAALLWELFPGAGAAADLSYIEPGLTAGKVAGTGVRGFLSALKSASLRNPLLALLLISQADVVFWAPSVLRAPIETLANNATGYKITLENAVKAGNWDVARTALRNLEDTYDEMEKQLGSLPVGFFSAAGVNYGDFRAVLSSGRSALAAYRSQYPQLLAVPVTFPKEFLLENAQVIDGDSIAFPGHPEVKNEIRLLGIDCHESETAAGKEETEYLRSLIQGKQVRVLVNEYGDPELTIDLYGRLLAGIFLGPQDVVLAMLGHFGKSILTESKYQKKYRWIDWDEYKKAAAAAKGPAVREFKLRIDSVPSGAKLYVDGTYTHHFTPSDEKELADVMDLLVPGEHVIKVEKAGKSAAIKVTLTDGANPDIMLTLEPAGLVEKEPVVAAAPPAEPAAPPPEKFSIQILSSPTRARLYIDGTYTHHFTPSDEKELADVMDLLQPGTHKIRAEKAGKIAEADVDVKAGYNEPVVLTLAVVGLPVSREELQAKVQAYRAILEQLEKELAALPPSV